MGSLAVLLCISTEYHFFLFCCKKGLGITLKTFGLTNAMLFLFLKHRKTSMIFIEVFNILMRRSFYHRFIIWLEIIEPNECRYIQ